MAKVQVRMWKDEAWPVYGYETYEPWMDGDAEVVEVNSTTFNRWEIVSALYFDMQREMSEIYANTRRDPPAEVGTEGA